MRDISRSMAVGAAWMILLRISDRSLGLVSSIILARLLAPADFGLVAMATSLIAMLELMSAFSFDVALIRKDDATRQHYDTVWTISVLFALLTTATLCLAGGPVAHFYSEPRLETVLYCLALGTFVNGFANVGVVAFRKEMDFRREFLYMSGRKLAAVCTTIPLAFILRDYWALVSGMLVSSVATVGLSYWAHPFRPRFSITHFRELFNFSKWLYLNNTLLFLNYRSTDFIIGKISGAPALGVYSLAWEISTLPTTELVAPINRAVFPGYAKLVNDIARLRAEYLRVFATIVLFALPAGAGIAATATLIVQVVLGAKWVSTAPLMQILAFYGLMTALVTNNGIILVALGNARLIATLQGAFVVVLIPSLIAATKAFGPVGTAWTFLGLSMLFVPLNFGFVSGKLQLRLPDYFKIVWRPVAAAAIMGASVFLITTHLLPQAHGVMGVVILLGAVVSGALIYAAAVLLLWLLAGKPGGPERFVLSQVLTRMKFRSH